MIENDSKVSLRDALNLPNIITILRILLVPAFVAILFSGSTNADASHNAPYRWVATALFILAISTDGLDGSIARKRGLVTNLGKLLDPIADKALIGGALIALSLLGDIGWWATIAILVRELGITVFRLIVVRKRVIAASAGGKLKTILQSITVGLVLSPFDALLGDWVNILEFALTVLTVAITVLTGLQYIWNATKVRS